MPKATGAPPPEGFGPELPGRDPADWATTMSSQHAEGCTMPQGRTCLMRKRPTAAAWHASWHAAAVKNANDRIPEDSRHWVLPYKRVAGAEESPN